MPSRRIGHFRRTRHGECAITTLTATALQKIGVLEALAHRSAELFALADHASQYLRRYMPSNRLLDAIRTRRGLKWGIPAMLLAAPFLLIANICTTLIADGGPGWLHLVVLWAIWDALKFIIMGPVSLALLTRAHVQEAVGRRRARAEQATQDRSMHQEPVPAGALR